MSILKVNSTKAACLTAERPDMIYNYIVRPSNPGIMKFPGIAFQLKDV
jgi:hypothetical protein